jgi:hypothetical protein
MSFLCVACCKLIRLEAMWCAFALRRSKNGGFDECCLMFFIVFGNASLAKVMDLGVGEGC